MAAKKGEHNCTKEGNISALETNIENVMKVLDEIKEDIKDIKLKAEENKETIIKFLTDYMNKNFAAKRAEKILMFVGGVAGTIIVGALVKLILNQ